MKTCVKAHLDWCFFTLSCACCFFSVSKVEEKKTTSWSTFLSPDDIVFTLQPSFSVQLFLLFHPLGGFLVLLVRFPFLFLPTLFLFQRQRPTSVKFWASQNLEGSLVPVTCCHDEQILFDLFSPSLFDRNDWRATLYLYIYANCAEGFLSMLLQRQRISGWIVATATYGQHGSNMF